MRITSLKADKLRWLVNSTGFRRNPCGVIFRVFLWELYRLLNLEVPYIYDKRFPISLRPNEGVSRLVFYFGVSEPDLFDFYNDYLRPGMTVLDVGANIGLHALYMANRVAPRGRVHSFEPSPMIFDRLSRHVEASKLANICCHPFALGPKAGEIFFHQVESDTSRSFLSDTPSKEMVCIRTLDAVSKEICLDKIDFLKLDVEGFELGVLHGSHQTLDEGRIEVIQVELDVHSLARNAANADGVFSFLTKKGYVHALWDSNRKAFYSGQGSRVFDYNSFFVRPHLVSKMPS
jgi:FkbM family methyltransferase